LRQKSITENVANGEQRKSERKMFIALALEFSNRNLEYERFVANLSVWSTINYQPEQCRKMRHLR